MQARPCIAALAHLFGIWFVERNDLGDYAGGVHLENADRWRRVFTNVTRHLQPAPFEPPRVLRQAQHGCCRVPLVHSPRIEQQRPFDRLDVRPVNMPEDDHVASVEAAPKRMWKALVGLVGAKAQGPHQRLGLLDPARPVAVDGGDAPAVHGDLTARSPRAASCAGTAAWWPRTAPRSPTSRPPWRVRRWLACGNQLNWQVGWYF